MPSSFDSRNDLDDLDEDGRRDREISLGTSTILGAFFALALVCALFFGFGYTMGRKSTQTAPGTPDPSGAAFGSFKPPSGSPAIQAVPGYMSAREAAAANAGATAQVYAPASSTTQAPAGAAADRRTPDEHGAEAAAGTVKQPSAAAGSIQVSPEPPRQPGKDAANPPAAVVAPPAAGAPPSPSGSSMVQVAAVSHQEDADVLLAALRRKGYSVNARQEPQDHLIHVQIGPFPTRKDAEAMRQKLLADGYNAIVK